MGLPKIQRFKLRHYLVIFLLLLSSPVFSTVTVLLGVPMFGLRSKLPKLIFSAILFLSFATIFSLLASSVFGAEPISEVVKGVKFLFMGFCLMAASFFVMTKSQVQKVALIVGFALGILIFVDKFAPGTVIGFFRPPTTNNSAILIFFLSLSAVENMNNWRKVFIIAFLFAVAYGLDSRFLFVLSPLLLLRQPISLSFLQIILFGALVISLLYLLHRLGMWGTWSDVVRLQLYAASLEYFQTIGVSLIANGEEMFIDQLNISLPIFISERLELMHAHNAFLQILGGYGLLAVLSFASALACVFAFSLKFNLYTLRNQLIFIVMIMMIETVISDSRIMYIMFVFIGLQIATVSATLRVDRKL